MDKELTKRCTKCNRELPMNTDYYFVRNDKKDGFNNRCKECCGRSFTNKLTHIPQYGYIFCKKCDRELPHTFQYFPVDKSCKTGLRQICRECNISYGRFLKDGETPVEIWSEEEKILLSKVYKDYTGKELVEKFFPKRTVRAVESMASILGVAYKTDETYLRSIAVKSDLISKALKGRKFSDEQKLKISKACKKYYETHDNWAKGKHKSKEQCELISKNAKERGQWRGDKNPRHIKPLFGKDNGRWEGGIMNILPELRSDTKDWFNKSMEFCNYKCVVTSKNFDNIHHTTAFKDIVTETCSITGLDLRQKVMDYSEEETQLLKDTLKNLHIVYGYGACLCKEVHKLFHDTYGYINFSPYDFLDFVYRIEMGEFDNWFIENQIQTNINYDYMYYLEEKLKELESAAS